jgi:hypothetical protein
LDLDPWMPPHSTPLDGSAVASVSLDAVLGFGPRERGGPMRMQLRMGNV